MGANEFFWVSGGYVLLTVAIFLYEMKRTGATGPDVLSVFMALFVLQCCIPGVVIFGCLPFTGLDQPTGNPAFDRIYAATSVPSALLVLGLTGCFVFFVYAFMALGAVTMRRGGGAALPERSSLLILGSSARILVMLALGTALTLTGFWFIGDSLVERYANVILLRGYSDTVASTTLNAFAFGLTQTWEWLALVALFVLLERRGRTPGWYFCLLCVVIFAFLGVSRRAIFIPPILAYFTLVLFDGRWRVKLVLAISIPILLLVAYGKEAFSAVAYQGSVEEVATRYESPAAGILRTASDTGITVVESLGTINLLDLPPRFGVDHVLSIFHGAPISWFFHWAKQDDVLPTRVVRLSTDAFSGPDAQDIPPGLFGQMWLDFRVIGPVVWAFAFAAQLWLLQRLLRAVIRTRQAMAAIVLLTFIVALPINSGSYDFTFGVDIVVLIMCLALVFKIRRVDFDALERGGSPGKCNQPARPAEG